MVFFIVMKLVMIASFQIFAFSYHLPFLFYILLPLQLL